MAQLIKTKELVSEAGKTARVFQNLTAKVLNSDKTGAQARLSAGISEAIWNMAYTRKQPLADVIKELSDRVSAMSDPVRHQWTGLAKGEDAPENRVSYVIAGATTNGKTPVR